MCILSCHGANSVGTEGDSATPPNLVPWMGTPLAFFLVMLLLVWMRLLFLCLSESSMLSEPSPSYWNCSSLSFSFRVCPWCQLCLLLFTYAFAAMCFRTRDITCSVHTWVTNMLVLEVKPTAKKNSHLILSNFTHSLTSFKGWWHVLGWLINILMIQILGGGLMTVQIIKKSRY